MKMKKIISMATSAVLTAALFSSVNYYTNDVMAENDLQTNVFFIVQDDIDADGNQNQWYLNSEVAFRSRGLNVKINGNDVSEECDFTFAKNVSPAKVYNYKSFDYEVPLQIGYNSELVDATLVTKIGQEGDANTDHVVDVRDASAISRDIRNFQSTKKSKLSKFGRFLAHPQTRNSSYTLESNDAFTIAKQLAIDALKRANGNKIEQHSGTNDYSISLSRANGLPGETVSVQVVIDANDKFDCLDALIEWNGDLKSGAAVAVNNTECVSYIEDGMVSLVDFSSMDIKDGAIANIEFTIPSEAVPGDEYEIYFSSIKNFAVLDGDSSVDMSDAVNVSGTKIHVNAPRTTTTAVTQPAATTYTTVATTKVTETVSVKGDANLDGRLDIRDAAYIAKVVASRTNTKIDLNADFNGDGKVDIRDASAIAKHISAK